MLPTCYVCDNYFSQFDVCVYQWHKPTNDSILKAGTYSHQKKTLFFITNTFFCLNNIGMWIVKVTDIFLGTYSAKENLWRKESLVGLLFPQTNAENQLYATALQRVELNIEPEIWQVI